MLHAVAVACRGFKLHDVDFTTYRVDTRQTEEWNTFYPIRLFIVVRRADDNPAGSYGVRRKDELVTIH